MNCVGCKIILEANGFVKCNSCKAKFCFLCLNIGDLSLLNQDQLSALKCPACMNITTRRKGNDNTPVGSPVVAKPSPRNADVTSGLLLSDISRLLDEKLAPTSFIMMNLRSAWINDVKTMISTEINSAILQLKEDFSSTTDFMAEEIKDVKSTIKDKNICIKNLEDEQTLLRKQCSDLHNRLNIVEKISRGCNIEFQAVPETKNENTTIIFKKLCETINTSVPDSDIRACRRVAKMDASSKRPRNILITLSSSRLRDEVLSASLRYNKQHPNDKLSSKHVGIVGDTRRVYISEHLSPEDKRLFRAARDFAKEKSFKFVWVKFGQIYIRKDTNSDAFRVYNMDSLKKLAEL